MIILRNDSNLSFDMDPETIDNQFSEKDLDYIESNGNKNNNNSNEEFEDLDDNVIPEGSYDNV